jgi:hypothetical protein
MVGKKSPERPGCVQLRPASGARRAVAALPSIPDFVMRSVWAGRRVPSRGGVGVPSIFLRRGKSDRPTPDRVTLFEQATVVGSVDRSYETSRRTHIFDRCGRGPRFRSWWPLLRGIFTTKSRSPFALEQRTSGDLGGRATARHPPLPDRRDCCVEVEFASSTGGSGQRPGVATITRLRS